MSFCIVLIQRPAQERDRRHPQGALPLAARRAQRRHSAVRHHSPAHGAGAQDLSGGREARPSGADRRRD